MLPTSYATNNSRFRWTDLIRIRLGALANDRLPFPGDTLYSQILEKAKTQVRYTFNTPYPRLGSEMAHAISPRCQEQGRQADEGDASNGLLSLFLFYFDTPSHDLDEKRCFFRQTNQLGVNSDDLRYIVKEDTSYHCFIQHFLKQQTLSLIQCGVLRDLQYTFETMKSCCRHCRRSTHTMVHDCGETAE
ncbi:hypothetical protein BGZ63DRAFT_83605 [Mariannaea sp. PMI_226]|nr:hypothetical protein BGZ63DRAFT_83605 [Mariannaea sp. PMI_226]